MQTRLYLHNTRSVFALTFALLLLSVPTLPSQANAEQQPPPIEWRPWNKKLFDDAKQTKRFVILDLNAKWCHWCHFMEKRTYAHPDVRRMIDTGYLATKVDQDANPDLATRYGDWGWPATIIFDPNGKEVAKLRGFQRPSRMTAILYTILAHPERVPKLPPKQPVIASDQAFLTKEQRHQLTGVLAATYDHEHAGWGRRLKFLQPEVIEYALRQTALGDSKLERQLRETMNAASTLLDPEWGGLYQYSHERDWSAPHFEKIMAFQANGISLYAMAYKILGDKKHLTTAEHVAKYLLTKLRGPDGAFYTSQDADLDDQVLGKDFYKLSASERAKLGREPSIDKSIYARENGWAAKALLDLYATTGKEQYLAAAGDALEWIVKHRSIPGGGFAHGEKDKAGPYLDDSIAMARAMLAYYMATGEATWLARSAKTVDFIAANFKHPKAGWIASVKPSAEAAAFSEPFVSIEQNIQLARLANLLNRTHGAKRFRKVAEHAMRFLASDTVVQQQRFMLGTVLADEELGIEPAHITVIGKTDDPAALALHKAAMKLPFVYRRIDRWDPSRGEMPNPDVQYPPMDKAAAFACANQICSLPVFAPAELEKTVSRMMAQRTPRSPNAQVQ